MKLIDCRHVTINNFVAECGFQPTNAIFFVTGGSFSLCIGEQTAAEASRYGMQIMISKEASMDSMMQLILEEFSTNPES